MARIKCRAQLGEGCYDRQGRDEEAVYESRSQREDGTYDPVSDSVVCDWCYFELGAPTNEELPRRIRAYRRLQEERR